MNSNIIFLGTKVNIELKSSLGQKVNCRGEFAQILNDKEVVVLCKDGPIPLGFSKLTWVNGEFFHSWNGLLKFSGVLIKKEEMGSNTKLYIKIGEFIKAQSREFYRPSCNLEAEFRSRYSINNAYEPAKTKDISAVGVCIQFEKAEEISKDEIIDLKVWLKKDLFINMQCKVLRVSEFDHNKKKYCELGMAVESVTDDDKALLMEYITSIAIIDSRYWNELNS